MGEAWCGTGALENGTRTNHLLVEEVLYASEQLGNNSRSRSYNLMCAVKAIHTQKA